MHSLDPGDPQGRAAHKHPYIYDPKVSWRNGEIAARQIAGHDMEFRFNDIKREGIEKQVLFPTGINVATENAGGLGLACAQSYNNWVRKLIKGHEDTFLPVAMAPAGCPEEMANELRRCVKELGFKASHLVPYIGRRNLDHPTFYPYYQAAEELGVPLFCHPNSNGEVTDRFDNFFKTHVLGRVMNCTPALVGLVLGGVFEKFSKLKVAFFECSAEWPLYWMHRMDDDWEWAKDFPQVSGGLKMPPSEYVKAQLLFHLRSGRRRHDAVITRSRRGPHFDGDRLSAFRLGVSARGVGNSRADGSHGQAEGQDFRRKRSEAAQSLDNRLKSRYRAPAEANQLSGRRSFLHSGPYDHPNYKTVSQCHPEA
ncbi:MAG: amidohydrolase family protein [Candidatus Binatia bacterium]